MSINSKKKETFAERKARELMNEEIPDFWADRPQEWFNQFESYMYMQNKEDNSSYKFNMTVNKLKDKEATTACLDIIWNPPRERPYEALKKILLNVPFYTEKRLIEKMLKQLNDLRTSNSRLAEPMRRMWTELGNLFELMPSNDSTSSSSDGVQVVGDKGGWLCWYHWKFGANSTKCDDQIRCTYNKRVLEK